MPPTLDDPILVPDLLDDSESAFRLVELELEIGGFRKEFEEEVAATSFRKAEVGMSVLVMSDKGFLLLFAIFT